MILVGLLRRLQDETISEAEKAGLRQHVKELKADIGLETASEPLLESFTDNS
jgi:hypothetical protein